MGFFIVPKGLWNHLVMFTIKNSGSPHNRIKYYFKTLLYPSLWIDKFPGSNDSICDIFETLLQKRCAYSGNTEQGKCRLTKEYQFFLFFIGHWYYEKKIVFIKTTYSCRYSFVACNSRYSYYSLAYYFFTSISCTRKASFFYP